MSQINFPDHDRAILLGARLGNEDVTVTHFQGKEGLSRLFCFHLEFLSDNRHLAAGDLINKPATVGIQRNGGEASANRFFHGIVNRFSYLGEVPASLGQAHDLSRYRAEIVPWMWFLTRTTNCRIFQNRSVMQIIDTILGEHGGPYSTAGIRETYPQREYCVQYRESDFAFVSRLLEEEGIFYYFRHSEDGHELVLADQVAAYYRCDDEQPRFDEGGTAGSENHITSWQHGYEFHPGEFAHVDFNFKSPDLRLMSQEQSVLNTPGSQDHALYDYPGEFAANDEGRRYARIRMQEVEAGHDIVQGEGVCPSFSPGGTFQLDGHPNPAEAGKSRLITAVEHIATHPISGEDEKDGTPYENRFTCIPAETVFRPERRTERPFVKGSQTAIVTGPEGEELVYPDEYGRVKIQFHWDREGQRNENSSCWVRVSQDWAGKGYGSMYLPHIGQEVIVDFLEGDPDRPIITGRLYNAEQKIPVTLPDQKYISVVARDHYGNEIIFDGTPDDEHIIIHSPHHESWLQLGRSIKGYTDSDEDSWTVGNTAEVTVGTATALTVGVDTTVRLGVDLNATLGYSIGFSVAGTMSWGYGFNYSYFKGTQIANGGKHCYNSCDEDHVINAGNELSLSGGGGGPLQVGGKNSIVNLNDERLEVSFGKKNSPIREDSTAQKVSTTAAVLTALIGTGVSIGAGELAKMSDEDGGVTSVTGLAAAYTAVGVAGLTASALIARQIWEKHDPVSHERVDADAKITLNADMAQIESGAQHDIQIRKDDKIQLRSKGDINQFASGEVYLDGETKIRLFAPQVVATNGQFKTKNILDLG